jgi:predicted acetyltransferase
MTNHHPSAAAAGWQLRSPAPDELIGFMSPLPLAFGEDMPREDLEEWAKVLEPERSFGAVSSGPSSQVLGFATAVPFRLTVPGGEVPAAAVTGVAVRPDQRRRGILTALMRQLIEDARSRDEPVAVLWASEGNIYQRFGYGLTALDGHFEVDTRRTSYLRAVPTEGRVRLLDEAEALTVIPPVYEAMRTVTPGALTRSAAWWQGGPLADRAHRRAKLGPKYLAVHEVDGVAEGYAIYRIKEDWDRRGPRGVLDVAEAVTTSPRALRALWRFLFDTDLVRTVTASRVPIPCPLQLLLAEPRALGLTVNDGLWLRIVDLPGALAARSYAEPGSLVLEVSDAFCPWNAGRWRMDVVTTPAAVSSAHVERTESPADLIVDTTDLAAMLLGGTLASHLAEAGRIQAVDAEVVARADALFTSQRAPWCVSMF